MSHTIRYLALLFLVSTVLSQAISPAQKFSAKVSIPTRQVISPPKVKFRKILIKVGANGRAVAQKPAAKLRTTARKVVTTARVAVRAAAPKRVVVRAAAARPVVKKVIRGQVVQKVVRAVPVAKVAAVKRVQVNSTAFAWKNFMNIGGNSVGVSGAAMSAKYIASLFKKLESRAKSADVLYRKSRQAALAIYSKIQAQRNWVKGGINSLKKSADSNLLKSATTLQQILQESNVKPKVVVKKVVRVVRKVAPKSNVRVAVRRAPRRRLAIFVSQEIERKLLNQIFQASTPSRNLADAKLTKQQLLANVNKTRLLANTAAKKVGLALSQLKARQDDDVGKKGLSRRSPGVINTYTSGQYQIKTANVVLQKLLQMWNMARNGMAKARAIRLRTEKEIAVARAVTAKYLTAISQSMASVAKPVARVAARPVARVVARPVARIIRKPAVRVAAPVAVRVVKRVAVKPKVTIKLKGKKGKVTIKVKGKKGKKGKVSKKDKKKADKKKKKADKKKKKADKK